MGFTKRLWSNTIDYMKRIPISQFKAHCTGILEEVHRRREKVLITRRGKPIACVQPFSSTSPEDSYSLRGSIHMEKDILSPIAVDWEASHS